RSLVVVGQPGADVTYLRQHVVYRTAQSDASGHEHGDDGDGGVPGGPVPAQRAYRPSDGAFLTATRPRRGGRRTAVTARHGWRPPHQRHVLLAPAEPIATGGNGVAFAPC